MAECIVENDKWTNKNNSYPIRQLHYTSYFMQSVYIDLYQNGLEIAIRQIVDIAKGNNTFIPQFNELSNLVAYKLWEDKTLIVECHAQYYMEPISHFGFVTMNSQDQISFGSRNNIAFRFGFNA